MFVVGEEVVAESFGDAKTVLALLAVFESERFQLFGHAFGNASHNHDARVDLVLVDILRY